MSDRAQTTPIRTELGLGELSAVVYKPGTRVFREGDPGGCAFLIERGQVEIARHAEGGRHVLAVLGPGELFGEMAAIDGEVRSATATVVEEAELIPISSAQLEKKMHRADPLVTLLLRVVLDRLRSTQRELCHECQPEPSPSGLRALPDRLYGMARARAVDQIKLGKALRDALERREFELFYQPIIRCGVESTAGFEALLRWHRPECGLVPPREFIHLAEDTGLIVPIGLWVLETACNMLSGFQAHYRRLTSEAPSLFMSVNVSARQLEDPADVDKMLAVIRNSRVDPGRIKLEITEGSIIEQLDSAASGLEKLRDLGVTLAVDDFGIGYSSFSYLHRFHLDTLKVDRSFVSTMLYNEDSLQIVRAITSLAHELDMDVIAEGVEDVNELLRLREFGCGYFQGFLCSRPIPARQVVRLLKAPPPRLAHRAPAGGAAHGKGRRR